MQCLICKENVNEEENHVCKESQEKTGNKQHKNNFDWLKQYYWQKGQSGNPKGRPQTKTLKEFAREFLASMSEEARIEYLREIDPDVVWKMAEGNPKQESDLALSGTVDLVSILNKTDDKPRINSTDESIQAESSSVHSEDVEVISPENKE